MAYNEVKEDLIIKAQYTINTYYVIYKDEDDTTLLSTAYNYGESLDNHVAPTDLTKLGYIFRGWTELPQMMPDHDIVITASYDDIISLLHLIQVGQSGVLYDVHKGEEDTEVVSVSGGYLLLETPTTYEVWYHLRLWAEANGYFFETLDRQVVQALLGKLQEMMDNYQSRLFLGVMRLCA